MEGIQLLRYCIFLKFRITAKRRKDEVEAEPFSGNEGETTTLGSRDQGLGIRGCLLHLFYQK